MSITVHEIEECPGRKYRPGKGRIAGMIALIILLPLALYWAARGESCIVQVTPVMVLPFVALLLAIAVMPFVSGHWWDRHYPKVCFILGAIAITYYFIGLNNGIRMIHTAAEYFSFIALIGSLFVVSGGIHLNVKGRSTPLANTMLLAAGAVVANVLGTTGASMVLIRPFIRSNKYRLSGYQIVFFIFIVSNIGGMLTPIGDPPLFLGYLKGIPFFWLITRIWPVWGLATVSVLAVFFFIDRHNYKKLPDRMEHEIEDRGEQFTVTGLMNIILLVVILLAVFFPSPFREMVMLLAALASVLRTAGHIHEKNTFNFAPIKEVAILFAGIFATMTPAMDWLSLNAAGLGVTTPAHYYWISGTLSSFLDNAPTYINFLSAACGLHGLSVDNPLHVKAMLNLVPVHDLHAMGCAPRMGSLAVTAGTWRYILAISAGSVMFGAMTYIGNGPNFMVKSIAEQNHVKMPSFFGYLIKYSIPILLPVFVLIWLFFFYR